MAAAYADVLSLLSTAKRLHDSSGASISLEEIVEFFALGHVSKMGELVSELDGYLGSRRSETMDDWYGRASMAVRKLEDILEAHFITPHAQLFDDANDGPPTMLITRDNDDLEQVKRDIDTLLIEGFHQKLTMMKKKKKKTTTTTMMPRSRSWWSCSCWSRLPEEEEEAEDDDEEEEDDDGAGSSEIGHDIQRPKMVGFSREFPTIWLFSIKGLSRPNRHFIALAGMAGVVKTTLAKEVFALVEMLYDCRVWVTVGHNCEWKRLIRRILAQVDPENYKKITKDLGEKELEGLLKESFKDRRYFIVLDDVWDKEMVSGLHDQGIVLLTTRLNKVAIDTICVPCKIEPMDEEDSWDLLRERVFGEERCPHQLVEVGRKIAEECEGLPLLIVAVASLLSKADKTPEYWNEVAEKRNSLFVDAHDQIIEVLRPSYTHLEIKLRPTYTYMGVFPQKYKIQRSEIMKLWSAEGIALTGDVSLEAFATHCFVLFHEENIIIKSQKYEIKNCSLHSVFWHLCMREAGKNKFFHVLKKRADSLAEGIKGQRRLCFQNNVLFNIKDVYDAMASISTVRFSSLHRSISSISSTTICQYGVAQGIVCSYNPFL